MTDSWDEVAKTKGDHQNKMSYNIYKIVKKKKYIAFFIFVLFC